MIDHWQIIAYGIVVIGCGILSGVFFTFSDFVMKSLALVAASNGAEVMQVINREVYKSKFFILIIAMILLCLFLGAHVLFTESGPATNWIIAGSALYLIGAFGVTMVFNVPMNNELEWLDHASPATADYWAGYLKNWTFWNHVRTTACAGTALCYLIGLLR